MNKIIFRPHFSTQCRSADSHQRESYDYFLLTIPPPRHEATCSGQGQPRFPLQRVEARQAGAGEGGEEEAARGGDRVCSGGPRARHSPRWENIFDKSSIFIENKKNHEGSIREAL